MYIKLSTHSRVQVGHFPGGGADPGFPKRFIGAWREMSSVVWWWRGVQRYKHWYMFIYSRSSLIERSLLGDLLQDVNVHAVLQKFFGACVGCVACILFIEIT